MKFLRDAFRNFEPDLWGRFVFADTPGDEKNAEGRSETEKPVIRDVETNGDSKEIDAILENPLSFSIKSLRTLEKATLNEKQKASFRDVVQYYIALSTTKTEFGTPRVLAWVDMSPKLRKLLGEDMRNTIRTVLLIEQKNLESILAKDVWRWTDFELMRACSIYNILRKKKQSAEVVKIFEATKEKILERGKILLVRSGLNPSEQIRNIVSSQEGTENKPLSLSEQLLLLQIRALFPNSSDWGRELQALHWKKLTQDTVKGLSKKDDEKEKPRYAVAWEVVDFLKEQVNEGEGNKELQETLQEHSEDIDAFIEHGNKVQLAAFADKQVVLSRMHLKALKDIKNDETKDVYGWKENQDAVDAEQKNLRKEVTNLKFKIEGLEQKALDEALSKETESVSAEASVSVKTTPDKTPDATSSKRKEDIARYMASRDTWKSGQESIRRHLDGMGDSITKFETAIPTISTQEGAPANPNLKESLTEIKLSLASQKGEYETLKNSESMSPQEREIKETRLLEEIQNTVSRFKDLKTDKESEHTFFSEFQTKHNTYIDAQKANQKIVEKLKNTTSVSPQHRSDIRTLETEIVNNDRKWAERIRENERFNAFSEFSKNLQQKATEIEKSFWKGLEKRIKNHQLRAADYELLFKIENADSEKKRELGVPANFEIPEKLMAFRQKFQTVLNTRIDKVLSANQLKSDGSEDWYKAIYQQLSYAALREALKESLGDDWKQESILPQEEVHVMMEGAMRHFKEDVIGKLTDSFKASGARNDTQAAERAEKFFVDLESMYRTANTEAEFQSLKTAQDQYVEGDLNTQELLKENKTEGEKQAEALVSTDVSKLNEQYTLGLSEEEKQTIQNDLEKLVTKVKTQTEGEYVKKEELQAQLNEMFKNASGEAQEKMKNLLAERLLFEQTFPVRAQWAEEGHVIEEPKTDNPEETEEVFIPGRTQLNDLALKTLPISNRLGTTVQYLRDTIDTLQEKIKEASQSNDEKSVEEVKTSVEKFVDDWEQRLKHKVEGEVSLMRDIAEELFKVREGDPDTTGTKKQKQDFIEQYFNGISKVTDDVDRLLQEFKANGSEENRSRYLDIQERLDGLENLTNVRNGILAQENSRIANQEIGGTIHPTDTDDPTETERNENEANEEHEGSEEEASQGEGPNEGQATLEKYGYYEEGVSAFRKNFNEVRDDFNEKFKTYQTNINKVIDIVSGDIERLNENEFHGKYGIDPTSALSVLADHQQQKQELNFIWGNKLGNQKYFEALLKRVGSSNPEKKNQALIEFGDLKGIKKIAEDCAGKAVAINNWITDYEGKKKTKRPKRREFSLYDVYKTFILSFEATNKHWKRNSDRNIADIGVGFWGESNRWGKEFSRMQEESENARIAEFNTQYHDQPGWVIWEAVGRSKNQDEVRACINLLSEKGYLKWDDAILWRALNKLQRTVHFNIDEDRHLSAYQIREKVSQACSIVWTPEIFDDWDKGLEGNLRKSQDGYAEDFRKYESDDSARGDILSGMLQRWARGETEQCDPARYAGFLKQAFIKGKMNGNPDGRFYFIIQGMTLRNPKTGQTLLSRDVLTSFGDEFLARFPHVEFFSDKTSPKHKGQIVPKGYPGAEERQWNQADFEEWARFLTSAGGSYNPKEAKPAVERFFFHYIHMSPFARDRVQRMQRFADKEGDHDDAWAFFLEWDQRQLVTQLGQRSEGTEKNSPDFWRTFISSFPNYMKMMHEYIQDGDSKFKGTSGWKEERERILKEVGGRLKVGMTLMQSLLGNFVSYHARPMIFGKDRWEKDQTHYSFSMMDNKDKVNDFARLIFNQTGNEEMKAKYAKILDYKGYDHGATGEQLKALVSKGGDTEYVKINKLSEELLTKEKSNIDLFGNVENIEKALNQYVATM